MDLFGNSDKKTLYIIGNGFDIHHGIASRYSDFQEYLYATGNSYLAGQLETYYPNIVGSKDYRWGDLEKALGEIDYVTTYKDCNDDVEIDYDHMMQTSAILEDKPQQMLEETLYNLHTAFEQWVKSLDVTVKKDDKLYLFSRDGLFLNFNYTETLEAVYGIELSSITYIHGRRNSGESLILGHSSEIDPAEAFCEDNTVYEDSAYEGIINIANTQKKNVDEIIASKKEFWESLEDINRVVTYGHSFSDVDIPYFEKISSEIEAGTEWHFGCHGTDDKLKAKELANRLGIDTPHYCCFDF